MRKGDIVLIGDGSYAYRVEVGCDDHWISGITLRQDGEYEVLEMGQFPCDTDNSSSWSFGTPMEINNIKLQCILNPDRIVYTQRRFCSVVKSRIKELK